MMNKIVQLDHEWVYLLLQAKEAGITLTEVKNFIKKEQEKLKVTEIG
ncbi:Anti-repressor SinI [Gracilibacillus ureilyticus]|uniref:Anti-repressor SinI n=1 Tax=Gracilibacillus ureilyticus TaxID=531814 RepID=A0A1H9RQA0_9BACI|nr:anti-repressor SinI family protein [Gracilibacillus ureilyticus]SER74942.1 Anti-repressor SinI [Gracilibacillus ureilyticus]